jgi:diguanylate cyclase (GGDEF)-like protein
VSRQTHATTVLAARSMVLIGLCSAAMTWLTSFLPYPPGFDGNGVRQIGLVTALLSLCLLLVPWSRLPQRSTLALIPIALVLIAVHNTLTSVDAYRYGTFFLVLFMWIGVWHPRYTCLASAPFAAVAYVLPLLLTDRPTYAAWTALYALPVFVVAGEVLAWRSTALARAVARLGAAAVTDVLTGLPDRSVFEQRVADVVGTPAVVLYLDVDDFKAVNDGHGHGAGDQVLVRVADALRASVGSDDLAARVAGDEFGVVLAAPATLAGADDVLARVAHALRAAGPCGGPVRVSGGAALADGDVAHEVIGAADRAMYRAKAARHA